MNATMVDSILKFLIRRGLSLLGTSGMAVSDEWVTQTASLLLIGGNEAYQFYKAHKAEKAKAEIIPIR